MHSTIAYSTPPGFTPPAMPTTVSGTHRAIDARPVTRDEWGARPAATRLPRHDDGAPADVAFGLSWRLYLAAVVVSAIMLVLIGTHGGARRLDALVPAAVVFGVSLTGLADYARRGAER